MEYRKFTVIIGSQRYFDSYLNDNSVLESGREFSELIKISDHSQEPETTSCLFIKNSCYFGITESAFDRLGQLIESLTTSESMIYIHNPPINFYSFFQFSKRLWDIFWRL